MEEAARELPETVCGFVGEEELSAASVDEMVFSMEKNRGSNSGFGCRGELSREMILEMEVDCKFYVME